MSNIIHKKPYCSQRGAIMVFFALLLPLIFGFMGLGIDAGLVYVNKGKMQDIADATALAGAAPTIAIYRNQRLLAYIKAIGPSKVSHRLGNGVILFA